MAKLTRDDVVEIRQRRREGESYPSITNDMPVTLSSVWLAATGETWASLNSREPPVPAGDRPTGTKLTADDVREIRRDFHDVSTKSLADRFGVSLPTIISAARGTTWKHVEKPPPVRIDGYKKLTDRDVREIRRLMKDGRTIDEVAERYAVGNLGIRDAASGRTFAEVEGPPPIEFSGRSKMTSDIVAWARRQKRDGATYTEILDEMQKRWSVKVSKQALSQAVLGETWKHVDEESVK